LLEPETRASLSMRANPKIPFNYRSLLRDTWPGLVDVLTSQTAVRLPNSVPKELLG